ALERYAGITAAELADTSGVPYLEEYSGRPCPAAEAQAQPPPAPEARGAADMSVMSGAAP
ncbi:hypothetical protein ABHB30_22715, partial [Flavonifractor plautii]|uniref:hypothetical protein n=1 Tax=Flavonifractor plautii TaxID=292800 RepID=UPI00325A4F76